MIVTSIKKFEKIKSGKNKILARLFFSDKKTHCFWMSRKQYAKLLDCKYNIEKSSISGEIIAVFDYNHFVWAGLNFEDYSDMEYFQKKFKAEWKEKFEIKNEINIHIPKKIEPIKNNINQKLKRHE